MYSFFQGFHPQNPALMRGAVKLTPKMKESNNWKQMFLRNQTVWPPCVVKFNLSRSFSNNISYCLHLKLSS